MSGKSELSYAVSEQIAEISLKRPPVNALSLALLERSSRRCGGRRPTTGCAR